MSLLPRPRLICQRCRQPRTGLFHTCRTNSNRSAKVKFTASWPKCSTCGKDARPLHKCGSAKGDFGKRKRAAQKSSKTTRPTSSRRSTTGKPQHLYQSCRDRDCQRPACVAYREGLRLGYSEGYQAGIENCPREHK
jgi:hypothetical protein